MNRPLNKTTFKSLLSNLSKFVFFFIIFSGATFLLPNNVKATKECTAAIPNADVQCRCAKNECRLSTHNGPITINSAFTGDLIAGSMQYDCFIGGTTIDIKSAPFTQYTVKDYVQKLNLKVPINSGDDFAPLVMDDFSNNLNKKFIVASRNDLSLSSICKVTDGQAYWYDQGFFKDVMGGSAGAVGSLCADNVTPILVSRDLFGETVKGTDTFFGCLPNSVNGMTAFVLRLGLGFGTLVGVLIILINLIKMVGSSTNPEAVTEARKKMASGIFTLIGLYLGLTILSIAGLQILDLGSLGGGLFKLFSGG